MNRRPTCNTKVVFLTPDSLKVAGSSTVFPVANAWANNMDNASNFAISIEGVPGTFFCRPVRWLSS